MHVQELSTTSDRSVQYSLYCLARFDSKAFITASSYNGRAASVSLVIG